METTLKGLQTQLAKIEGEIMSLKVDISNRNKELTTKLKIIDELKNKIESFKKKKGKKPIVSEHALLRYCERVKGIDFSEIENEILNESVMGMVDKLGGSGAYPNSNGYQVKMKDNVVVTIIK